MFIGHIQYIVFVERLAVMSFFWRGVVLCLKLLYPDLQSRGVFCRRNALLLHADLLAGGTESCDLRVGFYGIGPKQVRGRYFFKDDATVGLIE